MMHELTEQDYDLLSQYIDGELNLLQSRALEKRLASDAQLSAQLQRLREVDQRLQTAFTVPEQDAAYDRVAALLQPTSGNVVSLPQRRSAQRPWHYAVAASLVAAMGVATLQGVQHQVADTADAPVGLAQFLESSLSSGDNWQPLDDGRKARAVLSYRSQDNAWCREFMLRADTASSHGVACRANGDWIIEVSTDELVLNEGSAYRPAAAGDTDVVARFIDRSAADIPLDSNTEQALIDSNWSK